MGKSNTRGTSATRDESVVRGTAGTRDKSASRGKSAKRETPGPVIAVTSEDDRFASARREGIEQARRAHRPLILYDWDSASLLSEPLPTWWSSDGWESRFPDRLDAQQLEAAGRAPIARQVREAAQAGVEAYGWLPSDHGPGPLAEYAAHRGAAVIVAPADLREVHGLEALVDGVQRPVDELEERANARVVVA
jgi:hypothetical protein